MASNLINIILCAIPETLYFSLFMIFTKNIKTKRILLCLLMFIQYAILMLVLPYNIWFHIIYTFMTFVILKMLYKEKALITDIFVFTLSSIILIAISFVVYVSIMNFLNNYIVAYIIQRILLFVVVFLLKNKLNKWYNKFNSLWNRKKKQKIRSLTVRNITVIVFNLMFYIINLGMIYAHFVIGK